MVSRTSQTFVTAWILAALALVVAFTRFRIPLMADDYGALQAARAGTERYWEYFGPILARLPFSVSVSLAALALGAFERSPNLFLGVFYAIHALAFLLLVDWLARSLFGDEPLDDPGRPAHALAATALAALALYPNDHELHLFSSVAIHSLGALFAVLGLRQRRLAVKTVFFLLGFGFYETVILFVAGALAVQAFSSRRRALPALKAFAMALLLLYLLRQGLAGWFAGSNARALGSTPQSFFPQLRWVVKSVLALNFHKENWPIAIFEWAAALLLFHSATARARLLAWHRVALLFAIPFAVAAPVALLPYQATRALYGPNLLRAGLLGALCLGVLRHERSQVRKALPVLLLLLSYGAEWALILPIKDANARAIAALEAETRARILACPDPCTLRVPRPDSRTRLDWVINDYYFPHFYERIRAGVAPGKAVSFVIEDE